MAAPERETVIVTRTLAALPAFEAAINGDTYFRILADGTLLKRDGTGTLVPIATGISTAYQTVAEEGASLTQRSTLNFIGPAITAVDNAGQARTDVTVTVPTPSYQVVEDEGTPLTARNNTNFVGAGVTATDAGGKTVVTIPGGGAANYQTVQEEGSGLTQRPTLNFIGPAITAVDNAGSTRTDVTVTIPTSYATVQEEGSGLTQRPTVNFIGAQVTAADDAGNNRTNVTITAPTVFNQTIEDEGTPVTQRANVNFAGAGVTVTDSGGKTLVTIPASAGALAILNDLVTTNQSRGTNSYAAIGTAGPVVTLAAGVKYLVTIGAQIACSAGVSGFMSIDRGATAAVDADAVAFLAGSSAGYGANVSRQIIVDNSASGTTLVLTAKYKASGANATFQDRFLTAIPIA